MYVYLYVCMYDSMNFKENLIHNVKQEAVVKKINLKIFQVVLTLVVKYISLQNPKTKPLQLKLANDISRQSGFLFQYLQSQAFFSFLSLLYLAETLLMMAHCQIPSINNQQFLQNCQTLFINSRR